MRNINTLFSNHRNQKEPLAPPRGHHGHSAGSHCACSTETIRPVPINRSERGRWRWMEAAPQDRSPKNSIGIAVHNWAKGQRNSAWFEGLNPEWRADNTEVRPECVSLKMALSPEPRASELRENTRDEHGPNSPSLPSCFLQYMHVKAC